MTELPQTSKYDFHVHYKAHAQDVVGHEEAMVQRAIEVGLSGLCFTEHSQRLPDDRLLQLRLAYPQIKLWSGAEISTAEGNDVLLFGRFEIPSSRPTWSWLRGYCKANGVETCLAHPFRKARIIPRPFIEYPPDYVEIASRNTPPWAAPRIADLFLCGSLCYCLVNSDSHKPRHLGWQFNYNDENAIRLAQHLDSTALTMNA